MSAPLNLTASQLRNLADALEDLTKVKRYSHVDVTPYAPIQIGIGDSQVEINWDDTEDQYVIADRNGS